MGLGDYNSYQKWNTSKTTDKNMLATDTSVQLAGVITVKDANHQLFIQKISFNPTTAAAQTVLFRDSNGTPLPIAQVPASQTLPFNVDFGPKGLALTPGKNLDIVPAAAGVAASIHIEAYEKAVSGAIFVGGQNQPNTGTQPGQ